MKKYTCGYTLGNSIEVEANSWKEAELRAKLKIHEMINQKKKNKLILYGVFTLWIIALIYANHVGKIDPNASYICTTIWICAIFLEKD